MTVHPSVPAQSVKELIALAKTTPLRYSSAGIGNGTHLAAELFTLKTGLDLQHIPYKGGGPALNAALGGEVQITFPAVAVGMPQIKGGRLRAIGFTGAHRLAVLPDVPTVAETVPGYVFDAGWHAWFAPAGTPAAIVNRLHAEVVKALETPRLREFFAAGGYDPRAIRPRNSGKSFCRTSGSTRRSSRRRRYSRSNPAISPPLLARSRPLLCYQHALAPGSCALRSLHARAHSWRLALTATCARFRRHEEEV